MRPSQRATKSLRQAFVTAAFSRSRSPIRPKCRALGRRQINAPWRPSRRSQRQGFASPPSSPPPSKIFSQRRPGVESEELLRPCYSPQGESADGNEGRRLFADGPCKRRRKQNRLVDGSTHRRDAADLVDGGTDDGKVQTLLAAYVAVKHFADVKP